ncbi:glycosyltransferase [Flagellimonas sp. DF-77]|uniref:glycosyltransferase n=1 Tax=Flagellimonas algarum TaxID=3230298 RepID=UPI0033923879
MRLSILIPVFNGQDFIDRCLNGILDQGIPSDAYEIILIDDGSTDDSLTIARSFVDKHPNIRLFSQQNQGAYATRNRLLELAQGDYIYNFDIDDLLVGNNLLRILDHAEERQLDMVGFRSSTIAEIGENGTQLPLCNPMEFDSGRDFIQSFPYHRVEVWWYLVRKGFLVENAIRFQDNANNADVVFTYSVLFNCGKMAFFDCVNHHYCLSENSIMRANQFKKRMEVVHSMHDMVLSLDDFVNRQAHEDIEASVLRIVNDRVSHFALFNMANMVRIGMAFEDIQQRISSLEFREIYPFDKRVFERMKLKTRLLVQLMNNRLFLRVGTTICKQLR